MPASEARVRANQLNAKLSTGPKTPEGKAISRGNALKHGMTGEGVVLPAEDVVEVEARVAAFEAELQPIGQVEATLVRRAAVLAVRMDRGVKQETAAIKERVRLAGAGFEAPEGLDAAEVARLRAEAVDRALFDPSKEACLARKYEAAAERGFFRVLQEIRRMHREAEQFTLAEQADQPARDEMYRKTLASFLKATEKDREFDAILADLDKEIPARPARTPLPTDFAGLGDRVDVPLAIGLAR